MSVATGAAVMVGAVATGGLSGAATLGRRYVGEKLSEGGGALGKTVFGDDKYAAMQTQWKRAGGFSMFKGVDDKGRPQRRGIMSSFNTVKRIATAGSEPNILSAAYSQGRVANRLYDYKVAKEQKKGSNEKKTVKVDKEIADLKKDREDNLITKAEYEQKLTELNKKKREIIDPTFRAKDDAKTAQADLEKAKKDAKDTELENKLVANQTALTTISGAIASNQTAVASVNSDNALFYKLFCSHFRIAVPAAFRVSRWRL
jgi:hypothetical protein